QSPITGSARPAAGARETGRLPGLRARSAAARSAPAVLPVDRTRTELPARKRRLAGVMLRHVREIALVVRNTDDLQICAAQAGEAIAQRGLLLHAVAPRGSPMGGISC